MYISQGVGCNGVLPRKTKFETKKPEGNKH